MAMWRTRPWIYLTTQAVSAVVACGGLDLTGPHAFEDTTEGNAGRASAVAASCERCSSWESDFDDELWREGCRLNTRDPSWELVFKWKVQLVL